MKSSRILLTVIVPALNEENILDSTVRNLHRDLQKLKISHEILIIENGSKDKTPQIARDLVAEFPSVRLFSLAKPNYGEALKKGIVESLGDLITIINVDLCDIDFINKSISLIENDQTDFVIGSKHLSNSNDVRGVGKKIFSNGYNFILRLLFGFTGTDTHGLKTFRREKIADISSSATTTEFVFDTELVLRSSSAGLRIAELPIVVKEIRPRRYSNLPQLIKTVTNTSRLYYTIKIRNWDKKEVLAVVGILMVGIFLRFFHFKDWFHFTMDEEHYAYMTRMITVNHHFPAIGGPVSGTSLYLSPLFLYLNAIPYFISHNSPLLSGILTTLLGVITIFFIFLIGKEIFNRRAGILAALAYAVSMFAVIYDRHSWNVSLTAFVAVFSIRCLWKMRKGEQFWALPMWILLSIGLSAYIGNAAALLFVIFSYGFLHLPVKTKYTFFGILFLIASVFPILFFELRHGFAETKAAITFAQHGPTKKASFSDRILTTAGFARISYGKMLYLGGPMDISEELSLCDNNVLKKVSPPSWLPEVGILMLVSAMFLLVRRKETTHVGLWFASFFAINFIFLAIIRADPSERHFLPTLGAFFLLCGFLTDSLVRKKIFMVPIITVLTLFCVLNVFGLLNSNASFGFVDKERAVSWAIKQEGNNNFYVNSFGPCQIYGYRYLFTFFGSNPPSYMDGAFSWTYQTIPDQKYKSEIVFFNPSPYFPELNQKMFKKQEELLPLRKSSRNFGNVSIWLLDLGNK